MLEGTVLRRTLSRSELLSAPNVFQSVGRDVRQYRVAAQVDPVRTHELFGVKPILLAPNVSDCVEMPLQPRFTSERDVRQCRVVRGMNMSSKNAERMTKELTSLAPYTIKIKDVLPDGNIISVGAKRFRCADVFASRLHEISLQTS